MAPRHKLVPLTNPEPAPLAASDASWLLAALASAIRSVLASFAERLSSRRSAPAPSLAEPKHRRVFGGVVIVDDEDDDEPVDPNADDPGLVFDPMGGASNRDGGRVP